MKYSARFSILVVDDQIDFLEDYVIILAPEKDQKDRLSMRTLRQ